MVGPRQRGAGVIRRPLITKVDLGSACQGTPLTPPCRLDGGLHAADTPDRHCPDLGYALDGLHPRGATTPEAIRTSEMGAELARSGTN